MFSECQMHETLILYVLSSRHAAAHVLLEVQDQYLYVVLQLLLSLSDGLLVSTGYNPIFI